MTRLLKPILACLVLALAACSSAHQLEPETGSAAFSHDIAGEPQPWTHTSFDDTPDAFTFALFSDLTGGEREGIFSVAIEQLRLLRPEFIVNVGDLIEGGTTDEAQLAREWDSFDSRAGHARAPVFYTGGNHDLTNPVMWAVWEARYGPRYYHFIYKNTLFLVMAFVLGAVVGSFLNVCICRLPNNESVIRPRSRCPKCGKEITVPAKQG